MRLFFIREKEEEDKEEERKRKEDKEEEEKQEKEEEEEKKKVVKMSRKGKFVTVWQSYFFSSMNNTVSNSFTTHPPILNSSEIFKS